MKRGRVANVIPSVRWRVEVREDVAAKVELILLDPTRGTIAYGARSELITRLLANWLEEQIREKAS